MALTGTAEVEYDLLVSDHLEEKLDACRQFICNTWMDIPAVVEGMRPISPPP